MLSPSDHSAIAGDLARLMNVARGAQSLEPRTRHDLGGMGEPLRELLGLDAWMLPNPLSSIAFAKLEKRSRRAVSSCSVSCTYGSALGTSTRDMPIRGAPRNFIPRASAAPNRSACLGCSGDR